MGKESNRFRHIRIYAQVHGWLCLKDNALSDSQICIVIGPRIDLAIALIDRMKKLFSSGKRLVGFDTKETVIELNIILLWAFVKKKCTDVLGPIPNVKLLPQLHNFTVCRNSKEIESCNSYRLTAGVYA
jgi:hypothetical protein